MARSFNGSTDKLLSSSCPISQYPLTFASWGLPVNTGTNKCLVGVGSNNNDNFAALYLPSSEVAFFYFRLNSSTPDRTIQATTTASFTNWFHFAATIDSSRVPRIYVNGTLEGTGTDGGAGSFGTLTSVSVGCREIATDDFFYNGSIAEPAIWDRQLSGAEIAFLAKGFSPLFLRNGLKFYRSLIRDLNHPGIGPALTATGTSIVSHPSKIIYPRRKTFVDVGGLNQFIRPVLDVTRGGWKAVA